MCVLYINAHACGYMSIAQGSMCPTVCEFVVSANQCWGSYPFVFVLDVF